MGCVLDSQLFGAEKIGIILDNVYQKRIPEDLNAAWQGVLWFYLAGELPDKDEPQPPEKMLDWAKDSAAIWADFRRTYGIDLSRTRLHWWEFRAMLASLPSDSQIKEALYWRGLDLSKVKDDEQRAEYARIKRRWALEPVSYDEEMYARLSTMGGRGQSVSDNKR